MPPLALLLILILALVRPAGAAAPVPGDFASGLDLPGAADGGAYSVALPLAVYEQLTRADLADLRVFNGAGEVVAHALRRPDPEDDRREMRRDLPFFPLATTDRPARDDLSLRVRRDRDGTVLTVDAGRATATTPTAYLVDASRLETGLDALELRWQGSGQALCTVQVSQSSDLARWAAAAPPAVLADLEADGQTINRRRIPLHGRVPAYLRLDTPDCAERFLLRQVTAVSGAPILPANRLALTPAAGDSRGPERLVEFTLPARVTVRSLQLLLPAAAGAVQATVLSRPTENGPWRSVHTGLFYDLNLQGKRLRSDPVPCAPTTDRYWQVRLHADRGGAAAAGRLGLEVGWQPDQVIFVGRGPGPYTLAFASRRLDPRSGHGDGLLLGALDATRSTALIRPIEPGPIRVLGGEAALRPVLVASWTTLVLWAVLIAGVALLGLMARSLLKETRKSPSP
jgi:hypothetical protein